MAKSTKKIAPDATGLAAIDRLAALEPCSLNDYVQGASAYVREHRQLTEGSKKASQIRLSNALARALAHELGERIPKLRERLRTDEQKVAGGLRPTNADVSESHELDGLRIAVELKPINLAVGRAIWNRFGDIRTFAVNIHLKFPFCVVGGVLVIPTYEIADTRGKEDKEADNTIEQEANGGSAHSETRERNDARRADGKRSEKARKPTVHLIERAVSRLIRVGGRRSEAEATHLLEGIAVVVYDPDTATIDPCIPPVGCGLRWEEGLSMTW